MTKINSRWLEITEDVDSNSKRFTNAADGVDDNDLITKRQLSDAATEVFTVEEFVLDSIQINTTKYVTLSHTPYNDRSVKLNVYCGVAQDEGVDYSVSGTTLTWNGYDLDGILEVGDKLQVTYTWKSV